MNLKEATPRPWHLMGYNRPFGQYEWVLEGPYPDKRGSARPFVCSLGERVNSHANAQFVLRAVNEYEALIALEKAMPVLLNYLEIQEKGKYLVHPFSEEVMPVREALDALVALRKQI